MNNNYNKNFWGELKLKSNDKTNMCINEWDFSGFIFNGVSSCICGKDIKNLFEIKNNENGNTLIVGSSCVKKFIPKVHEQYKTKVKNIKKEMRDILKYFDGHRCKECKIYWKKIHRCPYNKLTDNYKKLVEDEDFVDWLNNLKERKGQAYYAYEYLLSIQENRAYNKSLKGRYEALEKKLNKINNEI